MPLVFKNAKIKNLLKWEFYSLFPFTVFFFFNLHNKIHSDLLISLLVIYFIYIVPSVWFVTKLKRYDLKLKNFFQTPSSKMTLRSVLLAATMPLFIGVGAILLLITPFMFLMDPINANEPTASVTPIWLLVFNVFTLTILAPFFEEFIFRGYLLNRFTYKYGLKRAILFTSIIFGVFHLTNIVGATVLGVVSCIFYIRFKTLLAPICVHMISNFYPAIRDIYFFTQSSNNTSSSELPSIYITIFGSLFLIAIGLIWFIPFIKRNKHYLSNEMPPLQRQ